MRPVYSAAAVRCVPGGSLAGLQGRPDGQRQPPAVRQESQRQLPQRLAHTYGRQGVHRLRLEQQHQLQ